MLKREQSKQNKILNIKKMKEFAVQQRLKKKPVIFRRWKWLFLASICCIMHVMSLAQGITREVWNNIPGTLVSNLTSNVNYPDHPSSSLISGSFEAPTNMGDNYGQRMHGFLTPTTSGTYQFWIAGDDNCELWLSINANPANAVLIASVPGWTNPREWGKYPQQHSVSVSLTAGEKYYIKALMKEGTGGDNLSVAWQGSGLTQTVIADSFLMPYNVPQVYTFSGHVKAAGNNPIAGVEMHLTTTGGTLVSSANTDANGFYSINNIVSGDYSLIPVKPGFRFLPPWRNYTGITSDLLNEDFTAEQIGNNKITREVWNNIQGNLVTQLTSNVNYPNNPSSTGTLTSFEAPSNIGDNYGQRVHGLLLPPVDGAYEFWIASDDYSELWLSTDENPSAAMKIASVSGWTNVREWGKYPSQHSVTINLRGGFRYYIRAVMKENNGGDNLAVAWKGPGITQSVIDGPYLTTYKSSFAISGKVKNTSGIALAGITVALTGSVHGSTTTTVTDLNGFYQFNNVSPTMGYYDLNPTHSDTYNFTPSSYNYTMLYDDLINQDFTATVKNGKISGVVRYEDGNGLAGVTMLLNGREGVPAGSTTTDAIGYYEFTNLGTGNYWGVRPSKAGNIFSPEVRVYASLTGEQFNQDFIAYNSNLFTISGTITDSTTSHPIAGASVRLESPGGSFVKEVTSNEFGVYTFFNVDPGDYIVMTSRNDFIFSPLSKTVRVLNTNLNNVNFRAYPNPHFVSGYVRNNHGKAMQGVTVTTNSLTRFIVYDSTTTDSSGYYILYNPGSQFMFYVKPSFPGYTFDPEGRVYNFDSTAFSNQNYIGTPVVTGGISFDRWNNITGNTVSALTSNERYPNSPDTSGICNSFEIPSNVADNYGERVYGLLAPAETGTYYFWIASDDNSELWLSTTNLISNKVKIAGNTNWTDSREWNKYPSQKSVGITLTAGQTYYIESIMKEAGGGDNLAVGWRKPSDGNGASPVEVIPGIRLKPWIPATQVSVTPNTATIDIAVSSTLQLTGTVLPNNAYDKTIIWSSGNNAIATVSSTGLVTGLANGSTDIIATTVDGNLGALCTITVKNSPNCFAEGSITIYKWNNIPGNKITDLTSNPNYPNHSDSYTVLTSFEIPTNTGDNYGVKVNGFICTPQTGAYTFWVAGDDYAELWLSTNELPANKVKIAYEYGWTNSREWNKYTTQKSASISLIAGKTYYVEALMKENNGGDNLAVGWRKPSDGTGSTPAEIIPGNVLTPWNDYPVPAEQASKKDVALRIAFDNGAFSGNVLQVYPNPFSDALTITSSNAIFSIKVLSTLGQEMLSVKCENKLNYDLNLSQLSNGIYVLQVSDVDGNTSFKKIIKE